MAQNYNVDDILEEIRRKKSREAAQDTYGQEAPPARPLFLDPLLQPL